MPVEINGETYYRMSEFLDMTGMNIQKFRRWVKSGRIKDAKKRDLNGWRLWSFEEIKEAERINNQIQE